MAGIVPTVDRPAGRATRRGTPEPRPTGQRGSAWWMRRTTATTLCVIVALYTLMPLLWLLFSLTKTLPELYGSNGFTPSSLGQVATNVSDVFTQDDGIFGRWILNTLLYAVVGASVATLLSVMAGYAFDKYEFRGREKWYGLVIAGVLIPHTAIVVPLYLMLSKIQMTDTVWSVLVPVAVNPFGVYLARAYCSASVPNELLEAARVDGASDLRTFFTVGLRLMAPGALTIFLFQFIAIWNNFFLPLVMLTNNDLFPLGQGLFTWNSAFGQNPDYTRLVVVGSAVATIPLLLLFVPLQRRWRAGMTEGSLK